MAIGSNGQSGPTNAPKERVNIRFEPAGGNKSSIELPFKQFVIGQFNPGEDDVELLEERDVVDIDKNNFNTVMASYGISLEFSVPDTLSAEEDAQLPVNLKFSSMSDFEPEHVVDQMPELKKLLDLRKALLALKGPLGNVPEFRKSVQKILDDEQLRRKLLVELGIDDQKPADGRTQEN